MNKRHLGILLLGLAAGCLFGGYEMVRSPSNVLFQRDFGVSQLPIAMAVSPLGLVLMLMIYDYLLSHLGPKKTLFTTVLISSGVLLFCYWGVSKNLTLASALLFVFGQSYVVLIAEQFWSFLDSVQTENEAKLWSPIYSGVAGIGAVAGGVIVSKFARLIGTESLVGLNSLLLIPTAVLSWTSYSLLGEPTPHDRPSRKKKMTDLLGLSMFRSHPVLFRIFFLIVFSQAVATTLGLQFQTELDALYKTDTDGQTSYSGGFFAQVNFASMMFQFLVTPILLRWIPLKWIFVAIPGIHFLASANYLWAPGLGAASLAYLLFKSIDYSLFRVSKELLYIPLPFDARYRAKEVIDTLGYRGSKSLTSVTLSGLQSLGMQGGAFLATATLFCSGMWLFLASPQLWNTSRRQKSDS